MRISIIGAGPAGAIAAFRLARAGASVTVFDPSHPREKPCGGGLTGRALELIADALDIGALPHVTIAAAVVQERDRDVRVPLRSLGNASTPSLVVVSRAEFDRALLGAAMTAGAHLVRTRVTHVSVSRASCSVHTTEGDYDTDYIIGADGANSLVRKRLAAPFSRAQLSIASGFFVHGASSLDITVRTMTEQPGYLWSFPRRDHLAVGVCTAAATSTGSGELRSQARHWIGAQRIGADVRLEPYAWPIPSIGHPGGIRTFGGRRWMLIGDAAGLVDPLTREGIYFALLSGRWAAAALADMPLERAAARYAARIERHVLPELSRAARLSSIFFSPEFDALLVSALRESPAVRDVFADLVAGVQPYRGLRRRLLATRQWRLAARTIRLVLTPGFTGTMKAGRVIPGNVARS